MAFVWISLGFAAGREATLRRTARSMDDVGGGGAADRVIVYYLHTTYRCATCQEIERLTKALLEREFAG